MKSGGTGLAIEGLVTTEIGSLVTNKTYVSADTLAQVVIEMFETNGSLDGMGIVDNSKIGFLSRTRFFSKIGSKFGYALYEKKPVRLLMEENALQVEFHEDTHVVISRALQREAQCIYDDIIVLQHGSFCGLVSMRSLMVHNRDILSSSMNQLSLLDEKSKKLEEMNRLQAEFVATMTHELRAPLNAILGVARLLLLDPRTLTDLKDGVGIIRNRGQELLMIINNILDFYKLEAEEMKPIADAIDVTTVLEDMEQLGRTLVQNPLVHVEVEL